MNLLKEWQHRLGLDDWCIKLEDNCIPSDMHLQEVAGETEWQEIGKCAVIRLLDEKCYGKRIVPYDKEKTLVHELLHIKFCFIQETENETQNRIVHQLIDDMAKALVDAKRRIKYE